MARGAGREAKRSLGKSGRETHSRKVGNAPIDFLVGEGMELSPAFSLFGIIILFRQIGILIWLRPQGPPKPVEPQHRARGGSSRDPSASVTQGFQNICPGQPRESHCHSSCM